jgi:hypothetical protein
MLTKSLGRIIEATDQRLVLLAPPSRVIPTSFTNVSVDPFRHADLLAQLQRLRGSVYLKDGALDAQHLSKDGLHKTPEDDQSWHLLMVDSQGRVDACGWYLEHDDAVSFDRLRVRNCPLAVQPAWRDMLIGAVESDLAEARKYGMGYAEIGGWAVAEPSRGSSEGLVLVLAGYSLSRLLGGALGNTTATVRHCSSTILRRLGGTHLAFGGHPIPSYYDARYKCEMELLRFDSRQPSAKYNHLIDVLKCRLMGSLVLASTWAAVPATPLRPQLAARASFTSAVA